MSTQDFQISSISIPHSLVLVGIIGGVWALLVIFVAVLAYLPEQPDFSIFNTYLSDIGDTPGRPQILLNSGTLIAVPIRYLVLVLLILRLMQLGAGKSFAIPTLVVGFLSTAGTALMTATPFSVSPIVHKIGIGLYFVFVTLITLYEQGTVSRTTPVIWEWLALLTSIVWMLAQSLLLGKTNQGQSL